MQMMSVSFCRCLVILLLAYLDFMLRLPRASLHELFVKTAPSIDLVPDPKFGLILSGGIS
jgi:hypothetical protein